MLLTKSCFNPALLRSDLRRCWPLLAGYTFLWFLILPLRMWNDVDPSPDDFLLQARSTAMEILGTSTTAAIWMNLIFGIMLAMALFTYLSSPRGTYGMHSFPASRGCQFRTHVLCGVGCVAVSNVLICLLSAQNGVTHWGASLSWLVFSLVTFLLFFALGSFCCMLCGWLPAMAVAYGAVNCVAIFCRILADGMCSIFYPSYNDTVYSIGRNHIVTWLTPVLRLHLDLQEMYAEDGTFALPASAWKSLLVYGIAALVLLAAGALLYRIRRSEASGDTLAFRPLRPVVRWAVGLLGGLGLGLVLAEMLNCTGNTQALLACIVTLGLVCMIGTQMLIARTPRVFGKLWPELLALCIALVALCLCIRADVFGYERRVPQVSQVESVEVYHRGIYGSAAKITDPREIDAIVQAHRYLAGCAAKDNLDSDWRWRNSISITYHLKNGGTLSRKYQLRDEDLTAVRAMLESETFRRSVVLDSVNVNAEALRHGYINNSDKDLIRDLSAQECKLLYQTLLEDIAHMNMLDPALYDYQNSHFDITLEDDEKTISARLNLQCTRTLALLQEWGIISSPGEAFSATDEGDAEDTIAYSGGMPNIAIA
ncbi:MAG: hypothetical protein ACLUF9_07440 [Oscillospiraceae bacterium]